MAWGFRVEDYWFRVEGLRVRGVRVFPSRLAVTGGSRSKQAHLAHARVEN